MCHEIQNKQAKLSSMNHKLVSIYQSISFQKILFLAKNMQSKLLHYRIPAMICIPKFKQLAQNDSKEVQIESNTRKINKVQSFRGLQSVSEARLIGSSHPGNSLEDLDGKQPIHLQFSIPPLPIKLPRNLKLNLLLQTPKSTQKKR